MVCAGPPADRKPLRRHLGTSVGSHFAGTPTRRLHARGAGAPGDASGSEAGWRGARSRVTAPPGVFSPLAVAHRRIAAPAAAGRDAGEVTERVRAAMDD
jgi:hypothetical protein